jgi:IS4 transposase
MSYRRIYSRKEKESGVIYDQTIKLTNHYASLDYPIKMRRIKYYDSVTGNLLIFLTNNFEISALEVAQLYKSRWDIEHFFKWIKQNLKIKKFWGQTENAVKTQIWIAVSVYALVAIAKKRFMIKKTLYEMLQIFSISIFEKMPINQLFQDTQLQYFKEQKDNQLKIFDL